MLLFINNKHHTSAIDPASYRKVCNFSIYLLNKFQITLHQMRDYPKKVLYILIKNHCTNKWNLWSKFFYKTITCCSLRMLSKQPKLATYYICTVRSSIHDISFSSKCHGPRAYKSISFLPKINKKIKNLYSQFIC